MRLEFVGGASTVTGSCFHLTVNKLSFLVDSGMHQGSGGMELNRGAFPFVPRELDCVFTTHAHIDHSGLLPRLAREGFKGRIITTEASRDLILPMLYDSANIQESDAEWLTKKALRAGLPPVMPLYAGTDVALIEPLFEVKEYAKLYRLGSGVRYRFIDAGHILGSASLEVWFQDSDREKKIVFSGDIGKKGNPIVNDPAAPNGADFIVMESTYGNRNHRPLKESIDELARAIKNTFKRGGNVYIPTFAVGRTQDIIYILSNLVAEGRLYKLDLYLDSPLAEAVTKIYISHPECFDDEARSLFTTASLGSSIRLHFVKTVEESMRLNQLRSGHIILAGSGMCEGGRIKHHLKHNIWRPASGVIFAGYQAEGTLGRRIVDGAKTVNILGEEIAVKASVYTINGFSAHADQKELLEWLAPFKDSPKVFLVHGEDDARAALASLIKDKMGYTATTPKDRDAIEL